MIKRRSVFTKLFSTYLLILFISFLFIGIVINVLVQIEIIDRYHKAFDHQQQQLISFFQLAKDENWTEQLLSSSLELNMNQEDRMIFLFDESGNIKYNENLFMNLEIDLSIEELLSEETSQRYHNQEYVVYLMSSPIQLEMEENSVYTMVMVFHEFDSDMKKFRFILNVTILIAIILAGIIIFFTSRKLTSPLREMNHSALQLAKGDFHHRVKVKTHDEIGQLGETFNYMAKELASIDQMRKDFVANVSHDLRSPLTSISGFLGALMDGTIPIEQQHKYFSIMRNETKRLMKLVNDLLDMARLEADQVEINPVAYNLSEQVRLIIAKMEPALSQAKMEIELLCEDDDLFVLADSSRIDQVFINLLQNAIQFSKENSKVEVVLERLENDVQIHIKDHGLGINEEDVSHIWERFYKKEKARSNKGGTGIGLSIVKHIIDLHDTSIHVKSELNRGTSFTFTLPHAEEK
ncbi:ATP-binding protein [Evansella sp. AB-rgal1]|uniref:HAMP domain-containing sensor histidine kinase n=1 Tax=Evansella sp. AB-rgal1 TaxID=3242696 RepID=UPI00359DF23E